MDALDSDRLTYGKWQRELEERFAHIHGRKFACFVNSGTDALRLGLLAMKEFHGWGPGTGIAVPAVTFVATLNAVLQAGLEPLLVDVELEHFGMDQSKIPTGASAAVPVNLFGHVPPPVIGLPTITDSCETMFIEGCADGDVSCFSTFSAHLITTGVGGLATTDDPSLAGIVRSLANHGRDGTYTSIDEPLGRREVMAARFNFIRSGYSSRGTEMQAAVGCAELDDFPSNINRRRRSAEMLMVGLDDLPLVLPRYPMMSSAWMMFPILAQSREMRDMITTGLEMSGIETRPLVPLTNQPFVRDRWGNLDDLLPNAHIVNETGFYVGCHQYLDDADIGRMIQSFRRICG